MDHFNWEFALKFTVIVAAFIALFRYVTYNRNEAVKRLFDTLPDFRNDSCYLGGEKGSSVAVDKLQKKLCFIGKRNAPAYYHFNQVLKCELMYETFWETITSTQTFRGKLRFRGENVWLSGSTDVPVGDEEKVKILGLKLTMNDEAKSERRLLFVADPIFKRTDLFEKKYELCMQWRAFFENLAIEKTKDSEKRTINVSINSNTSSFTNTLVNSLFSTPSTVDQLQKLKNLLDAGALTKEEFEMQKAKVLNR